LEPELKIHILYEQLFRVSITTLASFELLRQIHILETYILTLNLLHFEVPITIKLFGLGSTVDENYFSLLEVFLSYNCVFVLLCDWAGHVARMGRRRTRIGCWWESQREGVALGRPRCRWLDNIQIGLVEVGLGDVDWIGLPKERDRWRALVNSLLNLRVP
jgi:hypothetical protein